jgi:chemotaxis signal transduction protein
MLGIINLHGNIIPVADFGIVLGKGAIEIGKESAILVISTDETLESQIGFLVDYANDAEVVKVERLQANSELYFFQMRMKMDVNIVRPAEIVAWTAYKNAE